MGEMHIAVQIPTDSEGFLSLDCPLCGLRFKLQALEVREAPETELYCPYCGIPSRPTSFTPQDVIEAGMRKVENVARDLINSFKKDLERSLRGSRNLRFKPGKPLAPLPDKLLVEDESLIPVQVSCCMRHVKTLQPEEAAPLYCPYCGVVE